MLVLVCQRVNGAGNVNSGNVRFRTSIKEIDVGTAVQPIQLSSRNQYQARGCVRIESSIRAHFPDFVFLFGVIESFLRAFLTIKIRRNCRLNIGHLFSCYGNNVEQRLEQRSFNCNVRSESRNGQSQVELASIRLRQSIRKLEIVHSCSKHSTLLVSLRHLGTRREAGPSFG